MYFYVNLLSWFDVFIMWIPVCDIMTLSHCDVITHYGFIFETIQDMTNSWLAHQKKNHSLKPSGVCSDAQLKSLFGFVPFYPIWTIAGCQKQCRSCYRTSDNISRTCHNLSALWLIRGSKITEACWVPWHRKRLISKAKRCWMLQTEIWV